MSNAIAFDLDPPGTYIYTGEMALRGHRLTAFGLSLRNADNRARFLGDEQAYMQAWHLSDEERKLVSARDWTGLLAAGGHLQAILKIAATVGQHLWHIGAHNAGISVEELMRVCPRRVSAVPGDDA